MKIKTFIYIFLLVFCAACTKNESATSGHLITMAAYEAGSTKALLEENTFMASGNELCIYDYYTPVNGTSSFYIDGATARSNGSTWPFTGETRYEWTQDGVHKFYGWLTKDNSVSPALTAEGFFGDANNKLSFDETDHKLIIPTTTIDASTAQFDFMYSSVVPRNLNVGFPDYSPVQMGFHHFFTAIKVTAADNSSNDIYLKKVTIRGLKNVRAAEISYAGEDPVISYTYPANSATSILEYNILSDSRYTVDVTGKGVLLTSSPINVSSGSDFLIMWPHDGTTFIGAEIVVEYNYVQNGQLHENASTTIKMDNLTPWEAGQKHVVGLMFQDKLIELDCTVEPWNKTTEEIDFTHEITVSKPLTWTDGISDINEQLGQVYLVSDTSVYATCEFKIDTPKGSTWTASLIPVEGSSDAFIIADGYKYGHVGKDSVIKIRVAYSKPIQNRNIALLRITVQTADGRTIVANVMPSSVTNTDIKEYRIIQNLING